MFFPCSFVRIRHFRCVLWLLLTLGLTPFYVGATKPPAPKKSPTAAPAPMTGKKETSPEILATRLNETSGATLPPLLALPRPAQKKLPLSGWMRRTYGKKVTTTPLPADPQKKADKKKNDPKKNKQSISLQPVLTVPIQFPGDNEIVAKTDSWRGWDRLEFELFLPPNRPKNLQSWLFIKDWDSLWLQFPLTDGKPQPDGWQRFSVPLAGHAVVGWQPRGHGRLWTPLTAGQVTEYGLKFALAKSLKPPAFKGKIRFRAPRLVRDAVPPAFSWRVTHFQRNTPTPRVGKMVEYSFQVDAPFADPFAGKEVAFAARIQTPDKHEIIVRAFYFEDFLFDETAPNARLKPYGGSQFRIRFTPTMPGTYHLSLSGRVAGHDIEMPEFSFTAQNTDFPGFLRVSPQDSRFLQFSRNGREFNGIGVNVRSPSDNRYLESFPFSRWPGGNLNLYKHLFARYQKNGINVVEVWMSPWWLALEWMPDAPGNHGVGYFNQWRAWKLDRLLAWAEKYNIYLIILINNHGKFSSWCDSDWARNPYNKARGGWLTAPKQYFSDARSRLAFRHLSRYLVDRWSYSPHILAWKLFSEIDLTGANREWYKHPSVRYWHQEMGDWLHTIDPNRHLVTTHWADNYNIINRDLASLPELDILTMDAYYHGVGAKRLYTTLNGTFDFAKSINKPCIVTEFGGTPWGDSSAHILHQLHLGLWRGFFGGLAIPPCFWWFPLLEERNLYSEYQALHQFTKDESRIGAICATRTIKDGKLILSTLRNKQRILAWLFDAPYFFHAQVNENPPVRRDIPLTLRQVKSGTYTVEFWSCTSGTIMEKRSVTPAADGSLKILLPPFAGDMALKVIPNSPPTTAPNSTAAKFLPKESQP